MSCKDEFSKRKTYNNTRKLAEAVSRMSEETLVIYRESEHIYSFCREEEYEEGKGVFVCYVRAY